VLLQTLHFRVRALQSFANLDFVPVLPDVQFAKTLHFLPKLPICPGLHSVRVDVQLPVTSSFASSVPNDKRLVRVFDPIRASPYAAERVHFFNRDDDVDARRRRREEADPDQRPPRKNEERRRRRRRRRPPPASPFRRQQHRHLLPAYLILFVFTLVSLF